jgi:hypothetical protein
MAKNPDPNVTPKITVKGADHEQTVNCDLGQHDMCDGYIAPLVYSSRYPCICRCHDHDNPRSLKHAMKSAEDSFYGGAGRADQ